MEHFVIIVNGFQPLTNITKSSILDVAAVLDPPLKLVLYFYHRDYAFPNFFTNFFAKFLIPRINMLKFESTAQVSV